MTVSVGQTGYMLAGSELPIQSSTIVNAVSQITTTYKPVGVQLYITPQAMGPDSVKLHAISVVSAVAGFVPLANMGDGDGTRVNHQNASAQSMRDWCIAHVDHRVMPHMGHDVASARALEVALTALLGPAESAPGDLSSCRAGVQSRLDTQLKAVEDLLAKGDKTAARRALNVVFEAVRGRSFVRRKLIDVASTVVLLALVLTALVLMFAGGGVARDLLGSEAASVWRIARWPGAFASALLVFCFIYYVTPDVQQRAVRWITPGALVGVALWLAASAAFSSYLANFKSFNVTYGSFAAAIILLVWLWLTNVALLLGAEVNAEIERVNEVSDPATERETLSRPPGEAS